MQPRMGSLSSGQQVGLGLGGGGGPLHSPMLSAPSPMMSSPSLPQQPGPSDALPGTLPLHAQHQHQHRGPPPPQQQQPMYAGPGLVPVGRGMVPVSGGAPPGMVPVPVGPSGLAAGGGGGHGVVWGGGGGSRVMGHAHGHGHAPTDVPALPGTLPLGGPTGHGVRYHRLSSQGGHARLMHGGAAPAPALPGTMALVAGAGGRVSGPGTAGGEGSGDLLLMPPGGRFSDAGGLGDLGGVMSGLEADPLVDMELQVGGEGRGGGADGEVGTLGRGRRREFLRAWEGCGAGNGGRGKGCELPRRGQSMRRSPGGLGPERIRAAPCREYTRRGGGVDGSGKT
jgi:hypothetical protein